MRLVLTNGCFDILHAGHVDLLWKARALGDKLVVGLNSDQSVNGLKGVGRPVNPAHLRELVLRALRPVDDVIIFNEPTVTCLLLNLRPQVWVKGGDYTLETLDQNEVSAALEVGCQIQIVPLLPGLSTSNIIRSMNA